MKTPIRSGGWSWPNGSRRQGSVPARLFARRFHLVHALIRVGDGRLFARVPNGAQVQGYVIATHSMRLPLMWWTLRSTPVSLRGPTM